MTASLRARNAAPDERVAILCGTCPEMVMAREATTAAGMVAVPLDPRLAPPEIAYILAHARSAVVLVEPGATPIADAALARMLPIRRPEVVELARLAVRPLDGGPPSRATGRSLAPRDIGATLLYTSGTIGRPKGCWRSAEQEAARAAELVDTYGMAAGDVHLVACPLAYSAPAIFTRSARAVGAATALLPRFTPTAFLDAVARTRATLFFLVPTQLARLLARPREERAAVDLSSVRAVVVAGAPLAAATRAAAVEWLGPGRLWEFYGSSETGTITVLRPEEQLDHPTSVGRAVRGVDLRLEPRAEAAEIFVRSPTVMSGYWNPITMEVEWPGTADRFVSVGDLGRVDADGYLTLVDRMHDTIISGGVNVYPAEVERALADHPAVEAAVVFGVADPDWGQKVAAIVVSVTDVDPDALRQHLRERVAPHKIPKLIKFVGADELPRTSSGKPLRREAAKLLRRLPQ